MENECLCFYVWQRFRFRDVRRSELGGQSAIVGSARTRRQENWPESCIPASSTSQGNGSITWPFYNSNYPSGILAISSTFIRNFLPACQDSSSFGELLLTNCMPYWQLQFPGLTFFLRSKLTKCYPSCCRWRLFLLVTILAISFRWKMLEQCADFAHWTWSEMLNDGKYFVCWQMVTRTKKIFVGGLSAPSTIDDVKGYFEQFGRVSPQLAELCRAVLLIL